MRKLCLCIRIVMEIRAYKVLFNPTPVVLFSVRYGENTVKSLAGEAHNVPNVFMLAKIFGIH